MPERIQLKRSKGWRLPPNTVNVARPSKWGNPHRVTETVDAATAVERFRSDFGSHPEYCGVDKLRGKNLACWCKLGEPCHADVLLEFANG